MPKKWWKLSVMSVILISSSPGASTNDAPRGKAHRMVYRCAFNLRAVRKQNGIGFSSTGMCCETRQDAFRMWADEYVEIHWAFGSDEDNRRSSRGSAVNIELRLKTVKMDKFFFLFFPIFSMWYCGVCCDHFLSSPSGPVQMMVEQTHTKNLCHFFFIAKWKLSKSLMLIA